MDSSFQRAPMLLLFLFPVARQAENSGEHAVGHLVVQADAHIVLHAHVAKRRMFWKVRATPSLLACTVFMPAVSLPLTSTVPEVGW